MDNNEYIKTFKIDDPEAEARMLTAMNKYGENKWWLSKDLKEIAYYQTREDILLVDFSKFHEAITELLGRPVWTHEFAFRDSLLKQTEDAWQGIQRNKESDIKEGFENLIKLKGEENVLILTPPAKEADRE